MGKNKAQRTKNNARPSNSNRSAEFLGASAPSFVGFAAAKEGGYLPLLPGLSISSNTELNNIDPSFQMVLKKMNKKDATTKYKALLEFSELCTKSESETVEAMLPIWPRTYSALAIDVDHRVREGVQVAHGTLVKKVGKNIAVYLKQLAGPWFVSQYDQYPPAASAATNCFNNTFPSQKLVSAIVHCQDEILNYICDNVISLTPQGLTTNKSYSPEEIQAKYDRLLTSSLLAYSFYLKTVTPADIEKTAEYHKKLISSKQFWKLAKSEVILIKSSFFNTVTALVSYASNIASEEKRKILTTVMNSLEETDPALLSAVWEALLISVNKFEDWHKVVSVDKLVLPKLWRVLRNGGQYAASVVYPNLLPFLSQFMKFEVNKATLFTNFFENIRQGFSAKSLKFSRSEAFAVITSFVECFKYATLMNCSDEDICKNLLKDQLMPVVESCFCNHQEMKRIFFCELAQVLRYWCKNSSNSDYPAFSKLMKTFWFELIAIFNRLVDNDGHETTTNSTVASMAELLTYLKNAPAHSRRNMRVKFSDSSESLSSPDPSSEYSAVVVNDSENDAFLQELQQLVTKLCVSYFKRITDKPCKHKFINLVKIISGHESKELFTALAKTYDDNGNLLQFYNKNLKILMNTENEETETLIKLIFSIMSHMMDSEKEEVLQSFKEVDDVNILKTAVQCALMKKYREDNVVRKWCSQSFITNTLVLTAQDVVSSLELKEFDEKIFVQAFEPALDGDLIVNNEAICGISSLLCLIVDRMPLDNETRTQRFASLLSRLLELSWTHKQINLGATQLLKALFRLHIRDTTERSEEDGESAVVSIVQEAWTNGLFELSKRISETSFVDHVKYFSTVIWEKIFSSSEIFEDSLVNLTTSFIGSLTKINDHVTEKLFSKFMTELEIRNWMKQSTAVLFYGEVVTGSLYSSNLIQKGEICNESYEIDLRNSDFEDNTHKCLKWAAVIAKIFNNLTTGAPNLPEITEILLNLSYAAALGEIYSKHYSSTKHSNDVIMLQKVLHKELNTLKSCVSEDTHEEVLSEIKRLLLLYGGIYSYVYKFYSKFFTLKTKLFEKDDLESIDKFSFEILLQSAQIMNGTCDVLTAVNNDGDFYKIFLARNQLNENNIPKSLEEIFEIITDLRQTKPLSLLLDTCDVCEESWQNLVLPLEIIYFLTKCVKCIPKRLNLSQWDLIEICLASWNLSMKKTNDRQNDFKVNALIIGVNNLYYATQEIINEHSKKPMEELPPSLMDEWNNVFAADLQAGIFETWVKLADLNSNKDLPITSILPLDYLGKSLNVFSNPIISYDTSSNDDEIFESLLKLIHSPVLNLQMGAFIALNRLADVLVERDRKLIEVDDFEDLQSLNLNKFETILKTAQTIVNVVLIDFKLCDTVSCTIQPYTDSYTYTIGYLFTWNIIVTMCAKANGNLRYHYAEILKDEFFPSLLKNIFRLMPVEVLQEKNKNGKLVEIFTTEPSYDFNACWNDSRLDHLVCWLYTNCLRYLPVLVRQWWSTADSRVSVAVDKITALYVTPYLCNEELRDYKLTNIKNMQVKIHPTSRKVVALYQMDDTKLELNIILPPNHPLGTVTVEPGQHAGGTANWRNCHMQLSIFLMHQNGSIWDGLMLWKTNLDKRFAGVEECYICFSIFHISTYQIPKLSCQTCHKKFHSHCLYKWFDISNKSACPICRMVF